MLYEFQWFTIFSVYVSKSQGETFILTLKLVDICFIVNTNEHI